MTLRERIADWISGGALTRKNAEYESAFDRVVMWMERAKSNDFVLVQLQDRLDRITAQETPNANATVKRMARIARGEE